MDFVAIENPPVHPSDIFKIQKILRKNNVFVGGCIPDDMLYNPADYILYKERDAGEVRILFDRNIVTRLVDLSKGKFIGNDDELYRIAAAIMAFVIFCDIDIEPNLAIYEYAYSKGNNEASEDLYYFYLSDNIDPQKYADIALDRASCIDKNELNIAKGHLKKIPDTPEDFSRLLPVWELNYLFSLKIAQLKKSRLSPVDKIFKFYEWMANEVLFNAVASVFATQYLSPNPPSRKMIKNINSHGVSILNGIKNSAWDMTYLTYWGKSVKRNSCLNLLCSKDKGMIKIAKHLFSDESIPQEDSLTKLIGSCWGKYTRGIVEKYFDVLNCVNKDGDRDVQLPARFSMFPEMTKTLETELIAGK